MDNNLLATKVRVPPQPQHLVHRSRSIDALERGIPEYKLILVAAPAGYGKSTLLTQWAHSSEFPVAWLSIGNEDNDPERFLRYLLKAWEAVQPSITESKLGLLLGSLMPEREAILSAFINVASDISEHVVFVLDDYHLIEEPAIHKVLTFLLDNLPPTLHFVLASRGEPPLPLARYRARRALLEFRTNDLQFLPGETADFLKRTMNLDLAQDVLDTLHNRLEGWVAGLQLVALTLQQRLVHSDKLLISGKHRFIADYLSQDVLATLPEHVQLFLLQTSILNELCESLCYVVTEREDAQQMLESLERDCLFLVPLDDRREWFRYHQLFADFLRKTLDRRLSDDIHELHRRAAVWYLDHDLPEQAFDHALAGNAPELMVEILDLYTNAKLNSGEIRVVERWVNRLPTEWYSAYPVLGITRIGYLAYIGNYRACIQQLNEVEQQLTPADSESRRWQLTRVIAVRCLLACIQNDMTQAETFAQEALKALPDENIGWRSGIYNALGDVYRQNGQWEAAKECYLNALAAVSPQIRFMSALVLGALADLALRQGQLRDAHSYWRRALAIMEERENWGRLPLPVSGWLHIRLGELLYEWNEQAEAWEHLTRGLELAELGGDVRALIAGYLIAGRLKLTEGDTEAADGYLERARPLVENAQFSHWSSRFERFQLELWLAQERLRAAVDWSDAMLLDVTIEDGPESEVAQLAIVRVLIVKGDVPSIERALKLLKRLHTAAEAEGRAGIQIEALSLQALAHWRRGERADAMTALERALRLAEPEGYMRLFVDLGLSMARLLQEARSRAVLPDYVETLLAVFDADLYFSIAREPRLPEPLTEREHEILEFMAAGLTNQEIAEKLVISPETVKKHSGNIYGKLGVRSRTEAAARARELEILD